MDNDKPAGGEIPEEPEPEGDTCSTSGGETGVSEQNRGKTEAGKKRQRQEWINREAVEWVKSIAVAIVLALLIKAFVVQSYHIPTGSMMPTIMPHDKIFGNRFIFRFRDPQPGEIIAFIPPNSGEEHPTSYLKRIIGVENDTLEIRDGVVYRNGVALYEPYVKDPARSDFHKVTVPPGHLFVMGDNRNNSLDSRRWGMLPVDMVQSKAFFRFSPLNRIGPLR